jgi:hypothetical protein
VKSFPAPLVIRAVPPDQIVRGQQQYVLEQDFAYLSPAFGPITAPAGMRTDFASVPRLVWTYLSPEDPCILYGSIIHDYLYQHGGRLPLRRLARAECDAVLHEAMLASGARPTQAVVVHLVLRLFGSSNFCADVSPRMAGENVGRIPAAQQRGTGQSLIL